MDIKKIIGKIKRHSPISIGMRTFKTWIAATITATIALMPIPIIGNTFYALMGTVFGMQNTVSSSFKMGIWRIVCTVIGAFTGFIFAYFDFYSPPLIGLAIAFIIIICGLLKIQNFIFLTVTLCLLIMFNPDRQDGIISYTFLRTLDTAIGVVIGFLVNRFIAPPNHLKSLVMELEVLSMLAKETLKDSSKLPELEKELSSLMIIHKNFQADEKYDNHDVSNESLRGAVDACSDLYFHFKNCTESDWAVKNYHLEKISNTRTLLEKTLNELKGVI